MFRKILIANRGEIACRIIKTARRLGITTVAIYSSADHNSLHVSLADEAFWVGEAPATASYLNIAAILAVAIKAQVEAIHPGYGFLSENPQFAKACQEAGLIFIGPPPPAMEAMASKQTAKQILEKTHVPLTPGYHGNDQTDSRLLAEAKKIGFPILLKAASGGGGKGMRAVDSLEEFANALAGARREAKASFGDETMLIEKLIQNPRHVEIQIMADSHGQIVHLFERDCSIQRRHQKIIEEAPAPDLSTETRQGLAQAAIEVARAIHYLGAGTVEFLVDENQHFYFMEMNTRLQVEHPVTEMITGFDLVEWQFKIAAGEPLPVTQDDVKAQGHAIECRIYAEDPTQGFVPSCGQLHFVKFPQAEGIRIDSGVTEGSIISRYYDPMMAKLITWGVNRQEACQRMQHALRHFHMGGVKTNIPFLNGILTQPSFFKAELTTSYLTSHPVELPKPDPYFLLSVAASADYLALQNQITDPLWQDTFAWQIIPSYPWIWRYRVNEEEYDVFINRITPNSLIIQCQDYTVEWQVSWHQPHQLAIEDRRIKQLIWVERQENRQVIYVPEGVFEVATANWQTTEAQVNAAQGVHAPMPGTIVAILKNKGDDIKAGDRLVILEAMKMEHTIHAPYDGRLADIFYDVGAQVSEGVELVAFEKQAKD